MTTLEQIKTNIENKVTNANIKKTLLSIKRLTLEKSDLSEKMTEIDNTEGINDEKKTKLKNYALEQLKGTLVIKLLDKLTDYTKNLDNIKDIINDNKDILILIKEGLEKYRDEKLKVKDNASNELLKNFNDLKKEKYQTVGDGKLTEDVKLSFEFNEIRTNKDDKYNESIKITKKIRKLLTNPTEVLNQSVLQDIAKFVNDNLKQSLLQDMIEFADKFEENEEGNKKKYIEYFKSLFEDKPGAGEKIVEGKEVANTNYFEKLFEDDTKNILLNLLTNLLVIHTKTTKNKYYKHLGNVLDKIIGESTPDTGIKKPKDEISEEKCIKKYENLKLKIIDDKEFLKFYKEEQLAKLYITVINKSLDVRNYKHPLFELKRTRRVELEVLKKKQGSR